MGNHPLEFEKIMDRSLFLCTMLIMSAMVISVSVVNKLESNADIVSSLRILAAGPKPKTKKSEAVPVVKKSKLKLTKKAKKPKKAVPKKGTAAKSKVAKEESSV